MMSELEELFQKILDRYPAQSKLELKIRGVKERLEYGDKIIKRRYVLTVDYDSVVPLTPANSVETARKHHTEHGDMDGRTCLLSECALHYPDIQSSVTRTKEEEV